MYPSVRRREETEGCLPLTALLFCFEFLKTAWIFVGFYFLAFQNWYNELVSDFTCASFHTWNINGEQLQQNIDFNVMSPAFCLQ